MRARRLPGIEAIPLPRPCTRPAIPSTATVSGRETAASSAGSGNIGYLTSYQLMQAGAMVKAIIEAQPFEGGFPVQANRVKRLGIPVYLSRMVLKAIPNEKGNGITGAVIADVYDFRPVPGTKKIIDGLDILNICTGLVPDNQLLTKGREIFGTGCYGAGDALRLGEGTTATCPFGAITRSSFSTVPRIDFERCTGCMRRVTHCPGLVVFGYDLEKTGHGGPPGQEMHRPVKAYPAPDGNPGSLGADFEGSPGESDRHRRSLSGRKAG